MKINIIKIVFLLGIASILSAGEYKITNDKNVFTVSAIDKEKKIDGKWSVVYSSNRYKLDNSKSYIPKSEEISDNGTVLTLHVEQQRILKYMHITFKSSDNTKVTKTIRIKRNIEIGGVVVGYHPGSISDNGFGKPITAIVELVYEELYGDRASVEEKNDLRWKIDGLHVAKYDGKEYFTYLLDKEHKFKVYFVGHEDEAQDMSVR